MTDPVGVAVLVVQVVSIVIGVLVVRGLRQQVAALDGTVRAQAQALQALGELNARAVEMAKAFDPKKYLDAVNAYQELVERVAEARVQQTKERAAKDYENLATNYRWAMKIGLAVLAYIPAQRRTTAIESAEVPDAMKAWYGDVAKKAPDWSCTPLMALLQNPSESPPTD